MLIVLRITHGIAQNLCTTIFKSNLVVMQKKYDRFYSDSVVMQKKIRSLLIKFGWNGGKRNEKASWEIPEEALFVKEK